MEPNPQFTITTRLRPCRVTKSLLLDLERSIGATLSDIAGASGKSQKATKLSITDEDGEEILASAEQISLDQFQNSTKQIQLEVSVTSNWAALPWRSRCGVSGRRPVARRSKHAAGRGVLLIPQRTAYRGPCP